MKLWLAHDIQNRSLTEEFRNQIATAASRLPYFIEDAKASELNATWQAERAAVAAEDLIERANAAREVHKWATNAAIAGSSLRGELSEFIGAVEEFDPVDSLYWQRVYTLAGLEYPATKH
jgi:hypothetical protein